MDPMNKYLLENGIDYRTKAINITDISEKGTMRAGDYLKQLGFSIETINRLIENKKVISKGQPISDKTSFIDTKRTIIKL